MVVAQVSPLELADTGAGFMTEVSSRTAGVARLEMCIQCGSCGGSCPSAGTGTMDHTPRALFALIRAGKRDQVLHSNTPWMCMSCYHCTVRCPQEILITEVMYTLKVMAEEAGINPHGRAAGFSGIYAGNVRRFGRSWDMGLTARHYIRRFPLRLFGIAPMAMNLFRHGRVGIVPVRIRQRGQLSAILKRADELDHER
jgi:heterodisulfide reductase subunit C